MAGRCTAYFFRIFFSINLTSQNQKTISGRLKSKMKALRIAYTATYLHQVPELIGAVSCF
jgi:hypothetical protein